MHRKENLSEFVSQNNQSVTIRKVWENVLDYCLSVYDWVWFANFGQQF